MQTLYKMDGKGKIRQWRVYTDGGFVCVEHGLLNGKQALKRVECSAKNVGKSNETTPAMQAEAEALSKWTFQVEREGYVDDIEKVGQPKPFIQPMLAHDATGAAGKHINFHKALGSPKLDGCFSYNARVLTEVGYLKIGDIVSNRLAVNVYSFNEATSSLELKPITNWFNNGFKPHSKFLKLGASKGVTKNHRIYSEGEWISAGLMDGKVGARVTSPALFGVITGMLLGDGCAAVDKRLSKTNWRLKFSVCEKDYDYGKQKSKLLSPILTCKEKDRTSGYGFPQKDFVTGECNSLNYPLDIFYDENGARLQEFNFDRLMEEFTDLSLAIWYFDDGSIHYNNGNLDTPRIFLCVARYSEQQLDVFLKLFQGRYGVTPAVGHYGRDKRLAFTTKDTLSLLDVISKTAGCLLPRKMTSNLVLHHPNLELSVNTTEPLYFQGYSYLNKSYRYELEAFDIEVADNHNYFCEGLLVHNCRAIFRPDLNALQSRKGMFYEAPAHIVEALRFCNMPLDGELYLHGVPLGEIMGASKKWREDLTDKLEFHVFDVAVDLIPFNERYRIIKEAIAEIAHPKVQLVKSDLVITPENMQDSHNMFVRCGYEGLIIRHSDGYYGFGKRSYDLFKYKNFKENEFQIVGVQKDVDEGAVLTLRTLDGNSFSSRPRGTLEYRRGLLREELIGKNATVRYFKMTETFNPVPQFPVVVAIDDHK